MVIFWRLRGNIIRTAPCWVVWHNVHSQQHTHMSSSYRSSRLGLSHWDPYAKSCIIVTWWSGAGGIQALSARPTRFLQCSDTIGLVTWHVKIVPDMTCVWCDVKPCSINRTGLWTPFGLLAMSLRADKHRHTAAAATTELVKWPFTNREYAHKLDSRSVSKRTCSNADTFVALCTEE